MLILAKDFKDGEYAKVQDHFMNHWTSIGGIRGMMMISLEMSRSKSRVFILLPNNQSSPFYEGFEEIKAENLPREANLLVGYQDDFESTFSFPSRR